MTSEATQRCDRGHWRCVTIVEKFDVDGNLYEHREIEGNILVNAGIQLLWDLGIGAGGAPFSAANARMCVGDGTAAAAATQTDLQGTNKVRVAMEATFPSRVNQTVSFKGSFAAGVGTFAWNEWGVANSASGATILNRRVETIGTKPSGELWTLEVGIVIS